MKKVFFIFLLLGVRNAEAAVATTYCNATKVYTSCAAGYYLNSGDCVACAKGTYKSSSGTGTSCTSCPSSGGVSGTTATTASDAITDCYIPANSSLSDGVGTYTFTNNCYYTN